MITAQLPFIPYERVIKGNQGLKTRNKRLWVHAEIDIDKKWSPFAYFTLYLTGINRASVYERDPEKSRLDLLKNCFFYKWVQKLMDKWALFDSRTSIASKKVLWAKRIHFCCCFCLCFFQNKNWIRYEKKIAPSNWVKTKFNRVWAERKPRAIFQFALFYYFNTFKRF